MTMKRDRWSALSDEAAPKAKKFAAKLYYPDKERRAFEAGYVRGYRAGATRDEHRGPAKKCSCSGDAGCYLCYRGPVRTVP
jgi:hypothetical protein